MADRMSRRELMKRTLFLPVVAAGAGVALAACGNGEGEALTCTDTSGLTPAEIQARQAQEYTDHSPYAEKLCNNCQFWQPPQQADSCGGCQVIKGPIHPQGYCKLWVAQA